MELLKEGSKGPEVQRLQRLLGIAPDGVFGPGTKKAVVKYQLSVNANPDGIVGNNTWSLLLTRGVEKNAIDEDTDIMGQFYTTPYNQVIHKHYLPKNEYVKGPIKNHYIFIHHTAGWEDPYKCIDSWGKDNRGAIATEFVLGGQKVTTGDDTHDGVMVQAFPDGNQGWHLGKTGSGVMNRQSVGIELCNFGYLTSELKTYAGQKAHESQVCKLKEPFKGYTNWHNYSDKQIDELEKWLKYVADRDNIDLRIGLVQWIKKYGPTKAFEFQEDAYRGEVKGLLSHTNVRRDKFDCYPHPKLVEMLLKL
jgi:hypothetical protein